jgi:hypothetical protein
MRRRARGGVNGSSLRLLDSVRPSRVPQLALMHSQRAYAVFAEARDAHRLVAQRAIEHREATRPVMSSSEGYPELPKEAEREKAPGIAKTS